MSTVPTEGPKSNETMWAILGAAAVALVLATAMVGNPFRALRLAYMDYAQTPAAGGPTASRTQAPKAAAAVSAETK